MAIQITVHFCVNNVYKTSVNSVNFELGNIFIFKFINYSFNRVYIRFGWKLFGQDIRIPMGTNCAPLLLICFYFAMRETS